MFFDTPSASTIVVALLNGMMIKQVTDLLFKNTVLDLMKIIGNGDMNPIQREKASFLKGKHFADTKRKWTIAISTYSKTGNYGFTPDLKMDLIFVDGHTEKQMLPIIQYQKKKRLFCSRISIQQLVTSHKFT